MAGKYCAWTDVEVEKLIAIVEELNVMSVLDSKRQRNGDIFSKVAEQLNSQGKTMVLCRNKFKKLKLKYKEERNLSSKSGKHRCIV